MDEYKDSVNAQIIDLLTMVVKNQRILQQSLDNLTNTVVKWDSQYQNEIAKAAMENDSMIVE